MGQLILGGIGFILWGLSIILTYYSTSFSRINHAESTTNYAGYLISILLIYGIYKFYTVFFRAQNTIKINFWHIIGGFFLQLFLLCIAYTSLPGIKDFPLLGTQNVSGIQLFIHVVTLLLYPIFLILLNRAVGYSILSLSLPSWKDEPLRIRVLAEGALGFFVFTGGLLILGAISAYTLTGLMCLIGLLMIVSYRGWRETYQNIKNTAIEFENHAPKGKLIDILKPHLLSAELAFMVLSFLIGVSLINVIRPMPIGWDDLGVYMNFPKLMALSGETLLGAGMYAWQLITGTGFLFSYTAAQAFFVNQIGGILAVIAITSALSFLFESKNTKSLLALPVIFAAIFYAMPMNIFQQAKDMKLDPALLAMSIASFMTLFSLWKNHEHNRKDTGVVLLAGVLAGFAFSIKFTSLMLFLGGFALIAYRTLSLSGFLAFFFLFLGIFTGGRLWSMMNVWMPLENSALMNSITATLLGLGVLFTGLSAYHHGLRRVKHWIGVSLVFLGGIIVGIFPWAVKNTLEVQPWNIPSKNIQSTTLINAVIAGSGGNFVADYSTLYSAEEQKSREKETQTASITSSGQSQDEDLGRYFGYEKGINNYLKLPANLTFQKNQGGEFTDITFIYLAFFPALLLFIRSRRNIFPILTATIMGGLWVYWFTQFGTKFLGDIFGSFTLPLGYGVLILINLAGIMTAHFFIEKNREENTKIIELIIVLGVYGFLFLISAFGIVWYGILVYFIFLAIIGLAANNFVRYSPEDEKNEDLLSVKVTLTALFFIFIVTYFINSALPHGWNNLKQASYNEFKYGLLNQEESIFVYRQDYIIPISTMNLTNPQVAIERAKQGAKTPELQKFMADDRLKGIQMDEFTGILFSLKRNKNTAIANDAKNVGNILYKSVLYPAKYAPDLVNTGGIYRIGTFMTYLINENRERFYGDSLITGFNTYFYDTNREKTIERMKKLGLKYLLVDLNAATIDRDPRRALTTRFENLLDTMRAQNLKLVDTDNMCLRFALDEYKNGKYQSREDFINIAGTNYESYTTGSGKTRTINRGEKQGNCYNAILQKLYSENGATVYPYLVPIKTAIDTTGAANDNEKLASIFAQYAGQSWFALFEIQ